MSPAVDQYKLEDTESQLPITIKQGCDLFYIYQVGMGSSKTHEQFLIWKEPAKRRSTRPAPACGAPRHQLLPWKSPDERTPVILLDLGERSSRNPDVVRANRKINSANQTLVQRLCPAWTRRSSPARGACSPHSDPCLPDRCTLNQLGKLSSTVSHSSYPGCEILILGDPMSSPNFYWQTSDWICPFRYRSVNY